MKTHVRRFDIVASRFVALLPAALHKPFDLLGYVTAPPVWAIALIIYIASGIPENIIRREAVAILIMLPLGGVIKFLFRRNRPPTIYAGNMKIKSYSFPSSHAYGAALAGGFFGWTAISHGLPPLGIGLYALTIIIGLSRVHIGAHYPSDVLAGWALGIAILSGILYLL